MKTYDPLDNEEYLNVQAEALQGSAAAAQETLNGYNYLMDPYSASFLVPFGLDEMTYEYTGLNKSMFGTASTQPQCDEPYILSRCQGGHTEE